MNSEKVKEIKKALEHCGEKVTCQGCPEYNNEPVIDWVKCKKNLFQKTITLINELERENERLKDSNKNILFVNEYVIKQNDDLTKENQQLKNRIATLERKLDAKESYYNAVKDRALEVFVQKIEAEIPDESTFGYLGYNGVMEVIDEKLKECLGK